MNRARYQHYLDDLHGDVVRLGEAVHTAWARTLKSLETANVVLAGWVITHDPEIDEARRTLEERAIAILATQQPVIGHDLRLVGTISSFASELERTGDYARSVARRVRHTPNVQQQFLPDSSEWQRMSELVLQMIQISMDALLAQNTDLARQLGVFEHEVDELRHLLRRQVVEQIRIHPDLLDAGIEMLEIITLMERAADRTTNIGEYIIYLVEGHFEGLNEA